jgi:bifunctional oligoribonuclease and PAP phosphatase NrnA
MIYQLLQQMRVPVDVSTAEPLYVGLVTDTGRFQYSNTDARALRFAATMIDLGVEPQTVFSRVYEHVEAAKLRLLGRALQRVEGRLGGRLAVTWVTSDDLTASGADETATDGIVDYLRAIDGVDVAAFVRSATNGARWKVSLRANSDRIDVSRIAHSGGGGGHTRAAGFSSNLTLDELVAFIEDEVTRG